MRNFPAVLLILLTLIVLQQDPEMKTANGCAVVLPLTADVEITDEAALIIWDAENKTEHFIRKANFTTSAKDFGFLVPTPSQPELHESGDRVFGQLMQITEPRVEYRPRKEANFRLFKPGTGFDFFLPQDPLTNSPADGAYLAPNAAVEVIDELQVAGYDAAVLKADDPKALLDWLNEHGYVSRPALEDWLRFYTDNGWYLTAFRISQQNESSQGTAVARAVRITFKTDQPFYPYREPSDAREVAADAAQPSGSSPLRPGRLLRLFVLSDKRMDGTIGLSGPKPATTVWAGQLPSYERDNILVRMRGPAGKDVAESPVLSAGTLYLTELEDHSNPRQGTDELYLSGASDQSTVERPPIVSYYTEYEYSPNLHKWPFWLVGLTGVVLVARRWIRGVRAA